MSLQARRRAKFIYEREKNCSKPLYLPALVGAAPVITGPHPPAITAVQVPGIVVAIRKQNQQLESEFINQTNKKLIYSTTGIPVYCAK
jgi:hypothetical protein